ELVRGGLRRQAHQTAAAALHHLKLLLRGAIQAIGSGEQRLKFRAVTGGAWAATIHPRPDHLSLLLVRDSEIQFWATDGHGCARILPGQTLFPFALVCPESCRREIRFCRMS